MSRVIFDSEHVDYYRKLRNMINSFVDTDRGREFKYAKTSFLALD
jgi:hypothetical protein